MNRIFLRLFVPVAIVFFLTTNLIAEDAKPAKKTSGKTIPATPIVPKTVKPGKVKNAAEAKEATDTPEEKPDRYAVPEGGIEELTAFLTNLDKFRPRTRDDYFEHRKKGPVATEAAAKKIIELAPEAKSEPHRLAKRALLKLKINDARSKEEIAAVEQTVREYLAAEKEFGYLPETWQPAQLLCRKMEFSGDTDQAATFHEDLAELLAANGKENEAESLRAVARRFNLPGNPIQIEGKTLDGKAFNMDDYKGKLFLVDFWATWCGPCRAELPNVKRMYRGYHEKGFDVVGISLDSDRDRLEKFLEKEKLPWVTLFEDKAGWKHPAAVYYGIHGIPTCILVGADGKVISLKARGKQLQEALEERLGPPIPDEEGLLGTWKNANRRTAGVVRCEITQDGDNWTLTCWEKEDAEEVKLGPISLSILKSEADGMTANDLTPSVAAAGSIEMESGTRYFLLKLVDDALQVESVQLHTDGSKTPNTLTCSLFKQS